MNQQNSGDGNSRNDPFTNMMFGGRRPPGQQQSYQQPPQNFNQPFGHGPPQQSYQQPQQQINKPAQKNKALSYFMKEDGSWDYEKLGNGFQQVTGIAGKVTPMVKQISPLIALFKK